MATEYLEEGLRVIALDRQEVVDLVGLLTAQLAGVPLPGNNCGATPTIKVTEAGVIKYRLVLVVAKEGS